ncbi:MULTISPECIES: hypothetical protein [unclassified Bartonella]
MDVSAYFCLYEYNARGGMLVTRWCWWVGLAVGWFWVGIGDWRVVG